MNASKLSKQITRELQASPKKAAALGLLLLAAAYFWVPLVWKPSSKSPARPVANSATAVPVVTAVAEGSMPSTNVPATVGVNSTSAMEKPWNWRELARALKDDSQMQPVVAVNLERNPFQSLAEAEPAPIDEDLRLLQLEQQLIAQNPTQLGLHLQSTIVAPRSRAAMINGRTYKPGEQISVSDTVQYTLAEVSEGSIVLMRAGQSFELTINKHESSGSVIIDRAAN